MSPAQLEGKAADTRSDIFAFGLVLYEAIAGKAAFQAGSQASLIAAILKEEPPALSTLQPTMPAALDRVVRKCMAKDPDARWQTAADLHDELRWISETPAEMGTSGSWRTRADLEVRPTVVRKWLPAALVLAIGLVGGMFWQSYRAPAPAAWVATCLGGPSTAFCPRISPDGQLLAFGTMVNQQSQVAVMKSDGSSWTLLTNQKGAGYANEVSWAADGSKIYFSRFADRPRGVYSIPVLGGETRLLRDNAMGGYPLPDGSLIVAALASQGDPQLRRFWPDSGREESLPAFFAGSSDEPPGHGVSGRERDRLFRNLQHLPEPCRHCRPVCPRPGFQESALFGRRPRPLVQPQKGHECHTGRQVADHSRASRRCLSGGEGTARWRPSP